tara:strand:- start:6205 stop:7629 length:1425 start_codon:yes stop_codon:yes gene_type:complete
MKANLLKEYQLRVCCIGAGYVGGPTMVVIANHCPDILVNVVDIDQRKIDGWNCKDFKNLPVYEKGLESLLRKTRNKNLFFSNNVSEQISKADLIFICVNTPTKKNGVGAGKASDLKWIELCARQIAKYAKTHTIVVEKSTVPVKTAEVIEKILNQELINSNKTFSVLSNPEFLAEGSAIKDLENPQRVLIGGKDKKSLDLLSSIYSRWVEPKKIITTNLWSSELSKLTANAFLAQKISSINSITSLCEKTGAEINEVANAIGTDPRIGKEFLSAGPGFGGSCFKKDILNLSYLCEYYGLKEVADYWYGVLKINIWQQKRISNLIIDKLNGTVSDKKIAILGFSFKADTNDTRESPAIDICLNLLEEGANLAIHDPKVETHQIKKEFNERNYNESSKWIYSSNINEVINQSYAVILITEWAIYKQLKWKELVKTMIKPAWIFDTRMVINEVELIDANINYWRIGNKINSSSSNII